MAGKKDTGETGALEKDKKRNGEMNNAEMWASVMSKLNAMQEQQTEALQDIKDEIKATNSGFLTDISQIRSDINDIQNKLQNRDEQWEDLGQFKQGVLDEVKRQVTDHFASETGQLDCKIKNQLALEYSALDEKIKSQIIPQVENLIKDKICAQMSKLQEEKQEDQRELHKELFEKTEEDVAGLAQEIKRDFLIEKCQNRYRNLVLMGLKEPEEEGDEKENVKTTLQTRLSIPSQKIDSVYRLGVKKEGQRPRPLLMIFSKIYSRKAVWYNKSKINTDQTVKLRLQEDLPPELRWELKFLLKIRRQAKSKPELYPEVMIKDYRIIINGTSYGAHDEEYLPQDLRLSAIETPKSDEAVAFFRERLSFLEPFFLSIWGGWPRIQLCRTVPGIPQSQIIQ